MSAKMDTKEEGRALMTLTEETWDRLNQMWDEVGHSEDTLSRYRASMVKFAKELYVDMIAEEEKKIQAKREELAEIRKTYEKLCRLLKKEVGLQNQIPLSKYEIDLVNEINALEEERKIKMAKFDVVKAKEVEICTILEEAELDLMLSDDEMPGDQEIRKLEDHIHTLKKCKVNRIAEFDRLKQEIDSHFECLGRLPVTELENYVFVSNEALKLSMEWINSVVALNEDLKSRVEEASLQAQSYRARITALSNRLKLDINEEAIPQDCKDESLRFLSEEVDRLEALKRENMVTFISQIRDDLTTLWEKCMVRPDFAPKEESQFFDEELLVAHEKELQKWEDYLADNEVMLDTIVKRKELWDRYSELEIRSNNPERLNNRGGALLREDKERKESKAKCNKFRKEIEKLAKGYQEKNGVSFQVFGEELDEMFHREEEQLQAAIEEDKILRKNQKEDIAGNMTRRKRPAPATPRTANTQSVKRGRTNITSTKSPFLLPTSGSISKAYLIKKRYSNSSNANKEKRTLKRLSSSAKGLKRLSPGALRLHYPRFVSATTTTNKTMMQTPTPIRPIRPIRSTRKLPQSEQEKKTDAQISPASTYSDFQNHLKCQSTLNSSVANPLTHVNANNAKSPRRAPILTPARGLGQQHF